MEERKNKRRGGGGGGGGGESDDRISNLPDEILHEILNFLPTMDERVRTGVLSRRWGHLWATNPVLNFTPNSVRLHISNKCDSFPSPWFVPVVDNCLRLLRSSTPAASVGLRFLGFGFFFIPRDFHGRDDSPRIKDEIYSHLLAVAERWAHFAASLPVRELNLRFEGYMEIQDQGGMWNYDVLVPLPRVIFGSGSVSILRLRWCSVLGLGLDHVGGRLRGSLRKLYFSCVQVDDESLRAIISACPRLEVLALQACKRFTKIQIQSAPALKTLACEGCLWDLRKVEVIHAPVLQDLRFRGDLEKLVPVSRDAAPQLEQALLLACTDQFLPNRGGCWVRLVSSIAHLKSLSVNDWLFRPPDDYNFGWPVFGNLRELRWHWHYDLFELRAINCVPHFLSMLKNCPSLESLTLYRLATPELSDRDDDNDDDDEDDCDDHDDDDDDDDDDIRLEDPLKDFDGSGYIVSNLKTVVIDKFFCRHEEVWLLRFLLEKSNVLEKVVLRYENEVDVGEEFRKELYSSQRGSSSVCFVFSKIHKR